MKKFLALSLALLLVFALVACGDSTKEQTEQQGSGETTTSENVIKIGVFEPVTGQNGGGGFQEVLGVRYANEKFKTVDIGGTTYTIELVEVDNKSDKTEAVTAAKSLVASNVAIVLGSYGSGVSIAAGPTFEEAKIAAVGISCTNPQVTLGNEFYYRVCFLDPFQGKVMAKYAQEQGAKKAAIITELGDDYSSGLGNFFKKAFTEQGGEIVAEEQFQNNQTDFKAILTNIKATEPDVIFCPSSIATAPLLIQQARELGITAKIMAGDTWENQSIIDNAGEHAEGVAVSTFFDENDTENPIAGEFVKGFKEFIKGNQEYLNKNAGEGVAAVSALAYDSYVTAYEAIKKAQSTDPVAIKDALKGLELTGVTGSIKFDENGDAIKDMAYVKIVKDGKFTFDKTVKTE